MEQPSTNITNWSTAANQGGVAKKSHFWALPQQLLKTTENYIYSSKDTLHQKRIQFVQTYNYIHLNIE